MKLYTTTARGASFVPDSEFPLKHPFAWCRWRRLYGDEPLFYGLSWEWCRVKALRFCYLAYASRLWRRTWYLKVRFPGRWWQWVVVSWGDVNPLLRTWRWKDW